MSIAHNEEIRKIKYKNLMCKSVLKCLTPNGYNGRVYFVGCISRILDTMKQIINKSIKPIEVHSDKPYRLGNRSTDWHQIWHTYSLKLGECL